MCVQIHGKHGAAIFLSLKVETWEGQVWQKEGGNREVSLGCVPSHGDV